MITGNSNSVPKRLPSSTHHKFPHLVSNSSPQQHLDAKQSHSQNDDDLHSFRKTLSSTPLGFKNRELETSALEREDLFSSDYFENSTSKYEQRKKKKATTVEKARVLSFKELPRRKQSARAKSNKFEKQRRPTAAEEANIEYVENLKLALAETIRENTELRARVAELEKEKQELRQENEDKDAAILELVGELEVRRVKNQRLRVTADSDERWSDASPRTEMILAEEFKMSDEEASD